MRVGIGHDTHRLEAGGPLRIGSVDIPAAFHLVGHSDADVLLHAVTDALLGAASMGDIGELFPDSDPDNAGRDSGEMLREAHRHVIEAGFRIENIDCIVFAQQPKLSPYKLAIRRNLAVLLNLDDAQVGVKAKTGEGVGVVGRCEVIAAQAVVLLSST